MPSLTPTQARILEFLSDGRGHTKQEIFEKCVDDQLAGITVVDNHLCRLRKKLRPGGQDVATEKTVGRTVYRLVRLVRNPYRE